MADVVVDDFVVDLVVDVDVVVDAQINDEDDDDDDICFRKRRPHFLSPNEIRCDMNLET